MHALRDSSVRRLSAAIAGLALYLQLAFAGLGALPPIAAGATADALGGHALCLVDESGSDKQPANNAPTAPAHDHTLFCCLWHPLPGVAPQAATAPLSVSYANVAPSEFGVAALIPSPRHRPANARAPPALA
jgi:hypothetical protein